MSYNIMRWDTQYPDLLEKNVIGISRVWDRQAPPVTQQILPTRNMPFAFQWRVRVAPAEMAPLVAEASLTRMVDADMAIEKFVCQETKEGFQITRRELNHGLPNLVAQRTREIVDAVNLRIEYENWQALLGSSDRMNPDQSTARLQTDTATKTWDDADSNPIQDILDMKDLVEKSCGLEATLAFMGFNEARYLANHSKVLDQIKYTDPRFLERGVISALKGLRIVVVKGYYKDDAGTKHYILQDKVVITPGQVGFTAIADPQAGSAPVISRWADEDLDVLKFKALKSFVPVVEDYGRLGIIANTDGTV